jgi:acetolactate synthase I/II/III large subunit
MGRRSPRASNAATVAEAVGSTLVELGVRQVFGVVGSGNFHVTNAMLDAGARYVAARHEGGAATMADAYARVSGELAAVSVHQGCGLTNALTGMTEAAKARTPRVVGAGEPANPASNFWIDQVAVAEAVGAIARRITSASEAVSQTVEAVETAMHERRTVLLNLPLDVQTAAIGMGGGEDADVVPRRSPAEPVRAADDAVEELTRILASATQPVFIAGRGARHAARELRELSGASGALLATSAVAKGLFRGDPRDLDIAGGFATPIAADLIRGADVAVAFGCSLNMWTTRHGRLIAPEATVVQVDVDPEALGHHRPVDLGIVGDVAATAHAVTDALRSAGQGRPGTPGEERLAELARRRRWRDEPYDDWGDDALVDPRTLTILLDDLLPPERIVAVDSGNFMGYPSMFLDVPDEQGFCFTQAYQSIGLGLSTAIGAALARPDRLPVAALGDGGFMMAAQELDTVRRLGLPMVVIVYDDGGYGAEVHHFGLDARLDTVRFPPTDHAAIARGYGFDAIKVQAPADLEPVEEWLSGDRRRPLLVDAKVAGPHGSWWLEEAFRGH